MLDTFKVRNCVDENGNPAGGRVSGIGFEIWWQDGPLGRGDARQTPNGAFVETIIAAVKSRIEFYQRHNGGQFACKANAEAIVDLEHALAVLDARTKEREARQVEGTHNA